MTYWCVVPAAGAGRRFGGDVPKQYLPLMGRTVIQCTLNRLSLLEDIEKIVVPVSLAEYHTHNLSYQYPNKLQFIEGGVERSDSVIAGLEALQDVAQPDDWVLVHDVARPCVQVSDIELLMMTLADDEVGGILANPVRDTIKQVSPDDSTRIVSTVPREHLWQALTPQMFRYGLLMQALTRARRYKVTVNDEASAIEALGYQPRIVPGALDNLKITYHEDLALAEALLRQQK